MESKEEANFGNNVDKSDKTLEVNIKNIYGESTKYYVKESTKISNLNICSKKQIIYVVIQRLSSLLMEEF